VTAGPWAEAAPDRTVCELSPDEAQAWDGITDEIGARLLPVLEGLAGTMPSVTGVLVATADGFNLCALGLPADRVERICAMTSAVFSMASTVLPDDDAAPADLLTIGSGDTCTVVLAVPGLSVGPAVLWVSARHDTLGTVLYRSRAVAAEIAGLGV
jgi:predicted regulator of Ras-like GTPase activity (Roadblock/LC7/MglB family)